MTATADPTTDVLEVPTVDLATVHDHPANPRRDAVADDELVESIRAAGIHQPLIVAPAADGDGWVLIDGHRRKDAAARAGLTRVPVSPRYDLVTDAQQIEVMAVTGLTQATLSPVEEAAAYEQLALLGMDDAAIAAATGFGVRRVKQRMKLNNLSTSTRDSVHTGEVTLADIAALEEFEDDHEAYAAVEAHLGTTNFRYYVNQVREKRERDARNAKEIGDLEALGARRITHLSGQAGVRDYDNAAVTFTQVRRLLGVTDEMRDPAAHDGCLGWTLGDWSYATVETWCLDTTRHPELKQPAQTERPQSDWEKRQAERDAERARTTAADQARREWLTEHFTGLLPTKSHQKLAAFAGPFLVVRAWEDGDVPPADLDTPTKALAAFAAWITNDVAPVLDTPSYIDFDDRDEVIARLQLWDWLKSAGYPMSDVDIEIRTRLETRLTELGDGDGDGDGDG